MVILSTMATREFNWKECLMLTAVLTLGTVAVFIWGLDMPYPLFVITSYSIHYTKLYEETEGGMARAKGIKEVAYIDVGHGGAAQSRGTLGAGVQPMTWFDCAGGGQVVVEKGIAYIGNRITSYNVCYTKLLRFHT